MVDTQILILNWNNGPDTIECVKSVLGYNDARIILLDNNSTDNSVSAIKSYLDTTRVLYSDIPLSSIASLNEKKRKSSTGSVSRELWFCRWQQPHNESAATR